MELYDKRPVACRIAPFADRKDDAQHGIYNEADASNHASDQAEYTWIKPQATSRLQGRTLRR